MKNDDQIARRNEMAGGEIGDSSNRRDIYGAQPYQMEKYIVPGSVAVVLLFLLPWYWLGGPGLGGVDLGTAVIAALVLGHLLESLKVYQWGGKVRQNFAEFNGRVSGLLDGNDVVDDTSHTKRERAKNALFTVVGEGEGSEFAWNLVRWQKMTVIAVLLRGSALLWASFAILAALSDRTPLPFRISFRAIVFRQSLSVWWSVSAHCLVALALWVGARFVYKYGLARQQRTNEAYYLLIRRYWKDILPSLNESGTQVAGLLGDKT